MPEQLKELLTRLKGERALFLSGEEATRQGAILPILARLGWDRDNIREVVPEYTVGNGRVDYCLKIGEQIAAFVEVKRTNEELERHQEQLLEYAFRQGVKIAVLTNGLLWWFYLPLFPGSWDQRKFFTIDIQEQEVGSAASHFMLFLSREAVANGTALKKAEEMHAGREKDRRSATPSPRHGASFARSPMRCSLSFSPRRSKASAATSPAKRCLASSSPGRLQRRLPL